MREEKTHVNSVKSGHRISRTMTKRTFTDGDGVTIKRIGNWRIIGLMVMIPPFMETVDQRLIFLCLGDNKRAFNGFINLSPYF